MTDYAKLIQAVSSLLWPVLAFVVVLLFREQIKEILSHLRMKRGKFFGQEIEFQDTLREDNTSDILTKYIFPNGAYSEERAQTLNKLLRELGIERDSRLILDGAEAAPMRRALIAYARDKGVLVDGH